MTGQRKFKQEYAFSTLSPESAEVVVVETLVTFAAITGEANSKRIKINTRLFFIYFLRASYLKKLRFILNQKCILKDNN
jgi:hypothetical protein